MIFLESRRNPESCDIPTPTPFAAEPHETLSFADSQQRSASTLTLTTPIVIPNLSLAGRGPRAKGSE